MKTKAYFAAAIVALSATSASAAIMNVSGPNSSAGTAAAFLNSAPAAVQNGTVTNSGMQGFDEQQNVSLSGSLSVDGGSIATGTVVDSHMIFLNKADDVGGTLTHTEVVWTFAADILGVMSDQDGVLEDASTDELGATGTNYPTSSFNFRGLEGNDSYSISGNMLTVDMGVSQPGDWMRVVTETAPVPVPAAGVLLLGALGGLGGASALRRRRKAA